MSDLGRRRAGAEQPRARLVAPLLRYAVTREEADHAALLAAAAELDRSGSRSEQPAFDFFTRTSIEFCVALGAPDQPRIARRTAALAGPGRRPPTPARAAGRDHGGAAAAVKRRKTQQPRLSVERAREGRRGQWQVRRSSDAPAATAVCAELDSTTHQRRHNGYEQLDLTGRQKVGKTRNGQCSATCASSTTASPSLSRTPTSWNEASAFLITAYAAFTSLEIGLMRHLYCCARDPLEILCPWTLFWAEEVDHACPDH